MPEESEYENHDGSLLDETSEVDGLPLGAPSSNFQFQDYNWPLFNSYSCEILSVPLSNDDVVPRNDLKGLGVSMDKHHCLIIVGTSDSRYLEVMLIDREVDGGVSYGF
jgi:hypothetical protein